MSVEVKVAGLALDEKTKAPIVVLKSEDGEQVLPIVIGIMEASSIAAQLEGVDFPRPMTHDLMVNIFQNVGTKLVMVEITDMINDTFYARLHLRQGKRTFSLDARPSDSIALALRTEARITVHERVFQKSTRQVPLEDKDEDALSELLEGMDDDDFGKYKM